MSFCNISCFISIIFLTANIYCMLCIGCHETKNEFKSLLDDKQIMIYKKITEERRNIYFQGYGLGLFISLIILFYYKMVPKSSSNKKIPYWSIVCIIGAITLVVNYFYYILSPKSSYMIEHLKDIEQNKAWLKIYRMMQIKYHIGLIFGIIAVMFFAYAFRC